MSNSDDTDTLRETIRKNIRLALKHSGLNQSDLARDLGVVRQRINYILGSVSYKPTLVHVIKIAKSLGVSIDWMIDPDATWPPPGRPAPTPATAPVMTSEPLANLTAAQRVLLDVAKLVEAEMGEDPAKLKISIATLSAKRP